MDQFGEANVIVTATFLALASSFVALRFISRICILHLLLISDYTMLLGWVLVCALSASNIYATTKGLGLREGVRQGWRVPLARAEYVFAVLYYSALTAIKSSILLFYLRIMKEIPLFRLGTYFTLGVVLLSGLALTLVNLFPCRPLFASFLITTPPGTYCIDIIAVYVSTATINIATDVAIFFLPLPILWGMRLPKRQKAILLLTFGTGLFVIASSFLRTDFLLQKAVDRATKPQPPSVHDLSYYDAYVFLWSTLELNLGIMCACVPMLKPIFSRLLPRLIGVSSYRHKPDTSASGETEHRLSTASRDSALPAQRERPEANPVPGIDRMHYHETLQSTVHGGQVTRTQDFFGTARSKSMLHLSGREAAMPLIVMNIIFLLWGFAYGVIITFFWKSPLDSHQSGHMSFVLHATFFGAYLLGPVLVARPCLKQWGFKITLVVGLSIFWLGMLVFWPATVLLSLAALLVASFIAGMGASVVGTSIDLFVTLCGPVARGEMRLSIVRGIQAVGLTASTILSQQELFKHGTNTSTLITGQWVFLILTVASLALAVICTFLRLPDASDEELSELAERSHGGLRVQVCGIPVPWLTLSLAFLAQFCAVGSQEALQTNFDSFVKFNEPMPHLPIYGFSAIRHSALAIGCFFNALGLFFIKPRWMLLILYLCATAFSILSMVIRGYPGITMAILLSFFSSGVFPITFAISMRGMGRHTKTAAAILTTAVTGGALFPSIQNIVSAARGYRYGFCIEVALSSVGLLFSCYLNFVPAAKTQTAA